MRRRTSGDDEAARQHAQRLVKSRPGLHCRSRKDHDGGVHYLSGHFVARRAARTPVLGARVMARLYSVRGFPDVCRVLFFFFFSARAGSECTYVCLIDDTLRQQSREIMISVDQTPEIGYFP